MGNVTLDNLGTGLVAKIDAFVHYYSRSSRPFVWTATADSILQKIARLCSRISGTAH
jgi:hypothetical protein